MGHYKSSSIYLVMNANKEKQVKDIHLTNGLLWY